MPTIKLYEPLLAVQAFSLSPCGVSPALSEDVLVVIPRYFVSPGKEDGEMCWFETLQLAKNAVREMGLIRLFFRTKSLVSPYDM